MYLHVSAGRYMCGEETGLLNALEGKRANPRAKPPYPQVSGLWGKPTIVNNVETLANVPHIIDHGAEWFQGFEPHQRCWNQALRRQRKSEAARIVGTPDGHPRARNLEEHAGGMRDGLRFRGLLPGGASTDFLVEEHLDVPMDFTEVAKVGSRLGTGTMIVLDDQTCPVGMTSNLIHFFARESCGWCTPCWSGLNWAERILRAMEEGPRETRRFGEAWNFRPSFGSRPHVLRAGAGCRGAFAKRAEVFRGRFRTPHPRAAL
jgi:NADH-quinone oxidoreductase subunit F